MLELHNKKAIWEVTITGTTSSGRENIDGTYFEAITYSAINNNNRIIELTNVKALLKRYTTAFRTNKKGTAKSKALSEKITDLKSYNQDEILVQLSAGTYQTLEQFYTSTLFKSLSTTIKELNQVTLLNQIKEEITFQNNRRMTPEEALEALAKFKEADEILKVLTKDNKTKEINKESMGYKLGKSLFAFVCSVGVLYMVTNALDITFRDSVTRYINDDPYAQNKDYNLCMVAKDDISNCSQYAQVLERHTQPLESPHTLIEQESLNSKIELLKLATEEFNPKIYSDIESCTAKNLPDTRSSVGKFVDAPTLLFRCQSKEIFKIKSIMKEIMAKHKFNRTAEGTTTKIKYMNEEASSTREEKADKLYSLLSQTEENENNIDKSSAFIAMLLGSLLMIFTVFKQVE